MSTATATSERAPSDTAPAGGREANGRFGAGHPGGPGNPFGRRVSANRTAILDIVGPDEIQRIMEAMLDRALGGDIKAAKLILEYAVGKPQKAREPDLVDVDEFEVAKAKRVPHSEAVIALLDMPIDEATAMAGDTPQWVGDDPEERAEDEREEREEQAAAARRAELTAEARTAETRRFVAKWVQDGKMPEDSPFGPFDDWADPKIVKQFVVAMAQAARERNVLPADFPLSLFGDGAAEPITPFGDGERAGRDTVSAAS